MSETDDIKKYLEQGFQPLMVLRVLSADELKKLPNHLNDTKTRALPLHHPDGRRMMYYMQSQEAISFSEELVEKQKEVIGYNLIIYCSGIGPDTINGRKINLEFVIDAIKDIYNWEALPSDYPNTFKLKKQIEGDDQEMLDLFIERANYIALGLSLLNRHGFIVGSTSHGTRYKGQPFSVNVGIPERNINPITKSHITYIEKILENNPTLIAARALQEIYRQVTNDSRITVGWAAIEDIFSSKPDHLLTDEEFDQVLNAIDQLDDIPEKKRERLVNIIKNPNLISNISRNQRISKSISEMTSLDFEYVFKSVKKLSKERARQVHSLSNEIDSVIVHINFIEDVLWEVIESHIATPNPFRNIDEQG